jgi:hypothetical protein
MHLRFAWWVERRSCNLFVVQSQRTYDRMQDERQEGLFP